MHRVNAQRLQRLDFAQRARRAEFDDVAPCRRAPAPASPPAAAPVRARPQSPSSSRDSLMAPTFARAETVWPTTRNPSASATKKNIGSSATPARAISCRMRGRMTFFAVRVFLQNDAERDERKRAQPLHRQQEEEQFPPETIRVGFGQRGTPEQLRVRQLKCLCQISAHASSVAA